MKFVHRLAYYLGGFAIGLVLLAFFLSGKKTSCDYSPDARVLKNIRLKDRTYTPEALEQMERYKVDSTHIAAVLEDGDVDFSRSNTDLDSCKTYWITGNPSGRSLEMLMENCDSLVTVQEIQATP